MFILPGGEANKGESRMHAAIRELREEKGLVAYDAKYLFNYVGYKHKTFSGKHYFRNHHKLFLIKAKGKARPRHEVKHIAYYKPGNDVRIPHATKSIIDRYYKWKKRREREEKDSFFAVHEQSPSNYSKSCGGNPKY